ncbi:MAG TPA: AlkA N-terminal domain-containing protein [Steroidobacteraceae bacterium]|jgi:AraC family transcriptional regulator of adaptative response / DNA-3-methyladenine glycosylase II|nr:AlkA N-terminal domain-containing protein [Steroidobacteraceae bacterium]
MQEMLPFDSTVLERARLSRDPRFDGKFFIAVTSTGIYCRPICPASPSPRKGNVRYFGSAAAAAEAGFRPCLRCRPEAAPGTPAWLGTSAVVRRALRLINEGALDEVSVGEFAARVGVGARHLDRLFLQHVGASPLAVAQTRRLHFAKRLIDESDLPMTQIALAAGFGSLRRFNDAFRNAYRRPPRELRRERRGPPLRRAGDEVSLALSYRPPYDWDHLRGFLAVRATPGVERVDENSYGRLIRTDAGHAVIQVQPLAGKDALQLRVQGAPATALFQIATAARRVFDLSADPALLAAGLESDPLLRPLVRRRPGIRIPGTWDPFECAVRAVLGQQITVAAARTLAGRLVERVGEPVATAVTGLDRLFPTPRALAAANLDGLGLTGARIGALQALGQAVAEGRVAFDRPADEVVASLVELPGFGEWTAQYIALRALGEPDAFLTADLIVRRMAAGDGAPLTLKELERRADAWRPWRGYAVMHLWCAASDRQIRGGDAR